MEDIEKELAFATLDRDKQSDKSIAYDIQTKIKELESQLDNIYHEKIKEQ